MKKEIEINGYPGYYIRASGIVVERIRVNKKYKYKMIKLILEYNGRYKIRIKNPNSNRYVYMYVDILVANAFISNPKNYKYIFHKDHNLINNKVSNLEWVKDKPMYFNNVKNIGKYKRLPEYKNYLITDRGKVYTEKSGVLVEMKLYDRNE